MSLPISWWKLLKKSKYTNISSTPINRRVNFKEGAKLAALSLQLEAKTQNSVPAISG